MKAPLYDPGALLVVRFTRDGREPIPPAPGRG